MAKDNELISDYTDVYNDAKAGWDNYLNEAALDLDFYMDAQFTGEDYRKAQNQGRSLFVVNKLKRQIRLLEGYEIRNRHILKITPVGGEDNEVASQMTGAVMQAMNFGKGYDYTSQCFKWGPLITGSNLYEIWKDRNGILQFSRIGYNGFLLDPSLTKTDLSDCPEIVTGQYIQKDRVQTLVPEADLSDIPPTTSQIRWERLGNPYTIERGNLRLFERWYSRRTDYAPYVISRVTGQEIPFDKFKERFAMGDSKLANQMIAEMKQPNGSPAMSKYQKPEDKVRMTVFVDGTPVWEGDNYLGLKDYPFVWFHGEFCPEHDRDDLKLQGFTRTLRDPQSARNKRINQAIDIVESSLQAAAISRDKYLKNPEDVYKSGQGVRLHVDDDTPDTVMLEQLFKIVPGAEPGPGIFALMESLDQDTTDAGGLNNEIFGSDDKEIPGILHRYRTGQALTGQGGLFSGFRASKSRLGMLLIKAIQANYTPRQVARLLNKMPSPQFYDPDLSTLDCMPTEGLLTDTQQEMFYGELKMLRAQFPDMAQLITPVDLIKAAPIQFQGDLLKIIEQRQQQQQQMADAQMKEQQQQQKRYNQLLEAQTAADLARSREDLQDMRESKAETALTRLETVEKINQLKNQPIMEMMKMAVDLEKSKSKGG